MDHRNCGSVRLDGENAVSAVLSAYSLDTSNPSSTLLLYLSVIATHEICKAVRAAVLMGEPFRLTTGRGFVIAPEKKTFKAIAWVRLARIEMDNLILVHNAVDRDELIDGSAFVVSEQADPKLQRAEVLTKLYRYLSTPLYPEWYDHIWAEARAKHLLYALSDQSGVEVWKALITEGWQEIVSAGLRSGRLMALEEIAARRNWKAQSWPV